MHVQYRLNRSLATAESSHHGVEHCRHSDPEVYSEDKCLGNDDWQESRDGCQQGRRDRRHSQWKIFVKSLRHCVYSGYHARERRSVHSLFVAGRTEPAQAATDMVWVRLSWVGAMPPVVDMAGWLYGFTGNCDEVAQRRHRCR